VNFPEFEANQSDAQIPVNEGFDILKALAVYGRDPVSSTGLVWGWLGTAAVSPDVTYAWSGLTVTEGTATLAASSVTYMTVARATGVPNFSTSITNWNNLTDYARVFQLTTNATDVTGVVDARVGNGGIFGSSGPIGQATPAALVTDATTARAMDPTDASTYVRFTATGAKTATFDVADSFINPQEFHIANRATSGDLTLVGTGITLNPPKSGSLVLEPGDTATIKFISSSVADVLGATKPL